MHRTSWFAKTAPPTISRQTTENAIDRASEINGDDGGGTANSGTKVA